MNDIDVHEGKNVFSSEGDLRNVGNYCYGLVCYM